jgi:hypothetical protein
MKTNIQLKADILKSLMIEDRQEIREIRAAIYNRIYILTVSSFALVAFLFKDKVLSPSRVSICLITDLVIIVLIWILFFRLKKDLYHTRQCLEARQELINRLDETNTDDLNVFPNTSNRIPEIKDPEIVWIPNLSTVAIVIMMLITWFIGQ